MKTHSQIVKDAGASEVIAADRGVSVYTVRSWAQRNSIPSDHWAAFARNGWATLDELAAGAERAS